MDKESQLIWEAYQCSLVKEESDDPYDIVDRKLFGLDQLQQTLDYMHGGGESPSEDSWEDFLDVNPPNNEVKVRSDAQPILPGKKWATATFNNRLVKLQKQAFESNKQYFSDPQRWQDELNDRESLLVGHARIKISFDEYGDSSLVILIQLPNSLQKKLGSSRFFGKDVPELTVEETTDGEMFFEIVRNATKEFIYQIPQLLGNWASVIQYGFRAGLDCREFYADVQMSAAYTQVLGDAAKPNLFAKLALILNRHGVRGMAFEWVDKLKTGYRVKYEGMRLLSDSQFNDLQADIKQEFGDKFIKIIHDGEIKNLGHRPVPKGLTNYRIWFTHDVWKAFSR